MHVRSGFQTGMQVIAHLGNTIDLATTNDGNVGHADFLREAL